MRTRIRSDDVALFAVQHLQNGLLLQRLRPEGIFTDNVVPSRQLEIGQVLKQLQDRLLFLSQAAESLLLLRSHKVEVRETAP